MAFQRGDIVLIPFPFTDLSATKTRPAVVVSSDSYHHHRSELLLAYVSSQMTRANEAIDYVLADWQKEGLPKPSFVRPKIAAIESTLIVHQIGKLTTRDLTEIDRRLIRVMALQKTAFADLIFEVDWTQQPVEVVQILAEKVVLAIVTFVKQNESGASIESLSQMMKS